MGDDVDRVRARQQIRLDVGARVRELRQDAGLTQEALALEAGLARSYLIEIEWGKKPLMVERLFELAVVLGVAPSGLLEPPSKMPTRTQYRGGRRRLSDD